MPRSALLLALFAACICSTPLVAQPPFGDDPFGTDANKAAASKLPKGFARLADVDVSVSPATAKRGDTVTVKLTITPKTGGYTYPAFPSDPTQLSKNTVKAPPPGNLIFIGPVADPSIAWEKKGRVGGIGAEEDEYTKQSVTWVLKAVVSPAAKTGANTVTLDTVSLQVCDESNCYPADGEQLPAAVFNVEDGPTDKANLSDISAALESVSGALNEARDSLKETKTALEAIRKAARTVPGMPTGTPAPPTGSTDATHAHQARKPHKHIDDYTEELNTIAAAIVIADETESSSGASKQAGLGAFILAAALWGLISLVTPCVFPMIPITVSIFLKQAHGSFRERLKLAGVYSLTIITVLGISAFALLKFMAWLSAHPVTNVLLALLFLVLALSLFGMYELALPNSLQKRLQARQSQGGVIGTIFGALAFTVISFTCVAPFLGGFAGISAGNTASSSLISMPTWREIAGGLAFATAFATPFFVLALVPGLMRALPKSGGWLDSVKVVMGFLELAAALKFLRTAELRVFPTTQYFTYDVVLGGWVAISAACGLYLLNMYRLPHDEEKPNIGVPRLLFALMFLGLAIYLAPALYRGADGKPQRPAGAVYAWVEAFLLPESEPWATDLNDALARARESGKPVFVDFTGVTCTNCKYNEENVFAKPEFLTRFEQFEKVQLYTDEVPAVSYMSDPGKESRSDEAKANRQFQINVFKDTALPLYAVLMPRPDGKVHVLGVYPEGKINYPNQFAAFLQASLEKAKQGK